VRKEILVHWVHWLTALSLLCFAVYPSQAAQEVTKDSPALELYNREKKESLKGLPAGEATPHYSVTVVTQKLDATRAKLEFAVAGEMSSYALAIVPVNSTTTATSEITRTTAGEPVNLDQETSANSGISFTVSTPEAIIPINSSANTVEVTWTPRGTIGPVSFTLILPLKDVPSDGFLIASAGQREASARFVKTALLAPFSGQNPPECYWVQGMTQACGRFCKCCGGLSGNTIDYTTCRITCGYGCPFGKSCGQTPQGCSP
jgi:hypothetical protein